MYVVVNNVSFVSFKKGVSMGTEMKLYDRNDFLALTEGSDVAEAMAENMDSSGFSERDLVQVKTPSGGGVHWTIKGATGQESTPYIEGVIVYRCLKGVLWKKDEVGEEKPVLVSDDMKYGVLVSDWNDVPEDMQEVLEKHEVPLETVRLDPRYANVPEESVPRMFYWDGPNKLPYCEFGSSLKPKSKGKRAKDYQILYVLRANEGMPLRIQVGPTSIAPVRKFFNQMSDVPHYRAVVKLGLKEDKNANGVLYSMINPERIGVLGKEAGEIIKKNYKDVIKAAHEQGRLNLVSADGSAEE